MPTLTSTLRAIKASDTHSIDLITSKFVAQGELWTRRVTHRHACATRIALSPEGRPLSDFHDWPSLLKAAAEAQRKLEIDVE